MTIVGRHDTDELMLLASDGLWDVLSNQVAPAPPPPPAAKGCLPRVALVYFVPPLSAACRASCAATAATRM